MKEMERDKKKERLEGQRWRGMEEGWRRDGEMGDRYGEKRREKWGEMIEDK